MTLIGAHKEGDGGREGEGAGEGDEGVGEGDDGGVGEGDDGGGVGQTASMTTISREQFPSEGHDTNAAANLSSTRRAAI